MQYLIVNDDAQKKWGDVIEYCRSFHLANVYSELESMKLEIEEKPQRQEGNPLYCCLLIIKPKYNESVEIAVEWEDCRIAIEQCFIKAKRYLVRKKSGVSYSLPIYSAR